MNSEETRAHAASLMKIGYKQVAAYHGDADAEARAAFVEAKTRAQELGLPNITSSVRESVVRLWIKENGEFSNK